MQKIPGSRNSTEASFVGRREELRRVADVQLRARHERGPAAVLVVGDPGTGKSRLLAEIEDRSGMARTCLVGFEPVQSVPLAGAAGLLRRLAELPEHGSDLRRLVFGGEGHESRDALRIFEAAHRAVAAAGPMLLTIDDLQWLDDLSVGLVNYILEAAVTGHGKLVVVAAARPSGIAATFAALMATIIPADRRAVIELGPLSLEEGLALSQALDPRIDNVTATSLWRRAHGSPFWLRSLALGGGDLVAPSEGITDRLRVLGADAAALLMALTIGGRPLSEDDLMRVMAWSTERLRAAARELNARGLAVDSMGMLRTSHDLIREAVRRVIPVATAVQLHARFADVFEESGTCELAPLREALEHRAAAGLEVDEIALRIVTSPQRRSLGRDGLRTLASIADRMEAGSSHEVRLDEALGELASALGEQDLAKDRWSRVSEFSGEPSTRRHAEIEAARAAYRARLRDEAHRHLDRARGDLSAYELVVEATLEADVLLWLDHDTVGGARIAARALSAADAMAATAGGFQRLSSTQRIAYLGALHTATDVAMLEDHGDDVIHMSDRASLLTRALDDESRLDALLRIGFALLPFGRSREAAAMLMEAWELSQRLVMPTATVEAGNGLVRALPALGRLAEARRIALETGDLDRRLGTAPRRWGNAAPWLHAIELALGDPATALRALRRDAEIETDPHFRLRILQNIAAWQGRSDGARQAQEVEADLTVARSDAALAACPRCSAELSITSAELFARIGHVEAARSEMEAWREHTTGAAYPMREVRRVRAEAAIAAASGDAVTAATTLTVFCEGLRHDGLLEELLWARLDLGRILAGIDRAASIRALVDAATLAEDIGATSHARIAARELRRLGVRTWPHRRREGVSVVAGLSPRESEVARLVAAGISNREIAQALLISPKTVERHITNLLGKLGLRNRTELAALVLSTERVRESPDAPWSGPP